MCIDATEESGLMGHLINHGKGNANLVPRIFTVNDTPRVVFVAANDIAIGDQLYYDYGERQADIVKELKWLK